MKYQRNNEFIGWVKLLLGITFIETFLPWLTGFARWFVTGFVLIIGLMVLPIALPLVICWAIIIHLYRRDVSDEEERLDEEERMVNAHNDFHVPHGNDVTKR